MITLNDNDFRKLTAFMKYNYGINLESKRHLIEGRLCNFIAERGYTSFQSYLDMILAGSSKEELTLLLNRLTTNHTFFMREEEHFQFFEKTVLPELKERIHDYDLRVWSAGCSSGEEPYTLAMIMQNFFEKESYRWDKKILATDICVDVLFKAITGTYSKDSLSQLSLQWMQKYFKKINKDEYQIADSLKQEVIYRIFNLMDDFPFKRKFHVIFCRNVMIYFDLETKERLLQKFYDMTEPGGYLFIGLSESIRKEQFGYEYIMPSVYRKG